MVNSMDLEKERNRSTMWLSILGSPISQNIIAAEVAEERRTSNEPGKGKVNSKKWEKRRGREEIWNELLNSARCGPVAWWCKLMLIYSK
jgi:hypothetical protein